MTTPSCAKGPKKQPRAGTQDVNLLVLDGWVEKMLSDLERYIAKMDNAFTKNSRFTYFSLSRELDREIKKRLSTLPRIFRMLVTDPGDPIQRNSDWEALEVRAREESLYSQNMESGLHPTRLSPELKASVALPSANKSEKSQGRPLSRLSKARHKPDFEAVSSRFGVDSDQSLASFLGCSLATVRNERVRRGIPPANPRQRVDWAKWDHLLGVINDYALSREIGCHQVTVVLRRKAKGIPSTSPHEFNGPVDWNIWDQSLGVMTDEGIARLAGCHPTTVGERRRKLGIGRAGGI